MIKAILRRTNGDRILIFGVPREKAERLAAGRAVLPDVDPDLPGLSVLIVGGEDDYDIEGALQEHLDIEVIPVIDITPRIFGGRWDSPDVDVAVEVDTPVGESCFDCGEPIEPTDRGYMTPVFDGIVHVTDVTSGIQTSTVATQRRPVHLECQLRSTLSHIYHQCGCYFPDRSLRDEALATLAAINADRVSEGNGPL